MFQTKVVENIKKYILYAVILSPPPQPCRSSDNVGKRDRVGQVTDDEEYNACALHAGYLRLQTHTQNV
jgi:hypothetical protein